MMNTSLFFAAIASALLSKKPFRTPGVFFIAVLLGACAASAPRSEQPHVEVSTPGSTVTPVPGQAGVIEEITPLGEPAQKEELKKPAAEIYRGSGAFINPQGISPKGEVARTEKGEYTLNFEATDLQEVVKAVLGDILKENYVLDPKVTGVVTVQTSRPLTKAELLPALENLLRLNGAVLVREGVTYKVLPVGEAMGGPLSTGRERRALAWGYGTRIVPLRHIAAKEMHKILEPFLPPDIPPIVDEQRNLLILTGSEQELQTLLDLVDTFDVDWLRGMSVGLFRLQHAEAKTLKDELENIFGAKDGPLAGLVRVVPVERLNAVLVISPRPDYLDQARDWVERLDQVADTVGPRLYVYRVQNAKAKDLATVLGGIFGAETKTTEPGAPPAELAPGKVPAEISTEQQQMGEEKGGLSSSLSSQPGMGAGTGLTGGPKGGGLTVVAGKGLRIIADDSNNSLVIFAKAEDFKMIEAALRKLDVVPLQVLIEASVVEITLTDNLRYGIEWFFKNSVGGDHSGRGILDLNSEAQSTGSGQNQVTISSLAELAAPNFSYAILSGDRVRAVLNALAEDSKLDVLSSPSLMVLDNQTAAIKVVNQVPVNTQQQQATTAANAPIVNSIEFKEAGVKLEVTPRVNVGGRITLELKQDVTDVGDIEPTTNQRRFFQRNIQSSVTVQSGETIVLGGLISDNKTNSNTGIPFLKDVPLLGNLFSKTIDNAKRTELIVLLTPKAVRNQEESRAVTEEFRARLKDLEGITTGGYSGSRADVGVKGYPMH